MDSTARLDSTRTRPASVWAGSSMSVRCALVLCYQVVLENSVSFYSFFCRFVSARSLTRSSSWSEAPSSSTSSSPTAAASRPPLCTNPIFSWPSPRYCRFACTGVVWCAHISSHALAPPQDSLLQEVEAYLLRRFSGQIDSTAIVAKEDLELVRARFGLPAAASVFPLD